MVSWDTELGWHPDRGVYVLTSAVVHGFNKY